MERQRSLGQPSTWHLLTGTAGLVTSLPATVMREGQVLAHAPAVLAEVRAWLHKASEDVRAAEVARVVTEARRRTWSSLDRRRAWNGSRAGARRLRRRPVVSTRSADARSAGPHSTRELAQAGRR
jgi:hypothetical protein